jgi:uncharacterized membrane protein
MRAGAAATRRGASIAGRFRHAGRPHFDLDQGKILPLRLICQEGEPSKGTESTMAVTDKAAGNSGRQRPMPQISLRQVAFDAPWEWLACGWRDLWAAPVISFSYGVLFAGLAAFLSVGLIHLGWGSLILPLSGGFILVGPVLAVALYETSRRLEIGEGVGLIDVTRAALGKAGDISFFGAILGFIYVVWLQLAFLLLMLHAASKGLP